MTNDETIVTIMRNEELFNRYRDLGDKIASLNAIVQNDMQMTNTDSDKMLVDFINKINELQDEYIRLNVETLVYIGRETENEDITLEMVNEALYGIYEEEEKLKIGEENGTK